MASATNSQATNGSANNVDNSLYSPSSSTSLLYHIYDQINLPNEHQQAYATNSNNSQHQHHNQSQTRAAAKPLHQTNNTTVLNPADLFGVMTNQQQPQVIPQPQIATSTTLQLHHQQQQQAAEFLQRQKLLQHQQLYSTSNQYHLQPPPPAFSTLHNNNNNNNNLHHLSGSANNNTATYLGSALANQQALDVTERMVLDSVINGTTARHQHLANTLARQHNLQQQQQHQHLTYHARPVSSSGASSMSGHSMAVAYGRQPRPASSSKSQANLSSVLQSSQTLDYLGLGSGITAGLTGTNLTSGPKKLAHFSASGPASNFMNCKRAQQRVRKIANEYSTMLKCLALLVLLAFGLMSIIKLALVNQQAVSSSANINQANTMTSTSSSSSNLGAANSNNPLVYPFKYPDQAATSGEPGAAEGPQLAPDGQAQPASSDDLRSRLLIGEFVVASHNYSQSAAQRSLLADNIVKLMDQVFLASPAVRHFYARMEITGIRPNGTSGLLVDCNILLSESIAYAAQQFGIALYDSLGRTNELLAGQASFVIDKNSIRFNTVPDKDLRAGLLPAGLVAASVSRELLAPAAEPAWLSSGGAGPPGRPAGRGQPSQGPRPAPAAAPEAGPEPQPGQPGPSSVVWSEWSQWSSCVDKNGLCDPQRLHSRLRKCVAQLTGDKVEASQCKQRFSAQDQELEVADCQLACQGPAPDARPQSDEPAGPNTAPSVLLAGNEPASFLLGPPAQLKLLAKPPAPAQLLQRDPAAAAGPRLGAPSDPAEQPAPPEPRPQAGEGGAPAGPPAAAEPGAGQEGPGPAPERMSCANCTSDEICLLLVQQKVPFCAKLRDRQDETGCGGWCRAQPGQLCQPLGLNAFKCIHDSECLDSEWRCHDSACIPLDKRCDGHSNCYDNSDERDCPLKS